MVSSGAALGVIQFGCHSVQAIPGAARNLGEPREMSRFPRKK